MDEKLHKKFENDVDKLRGHYNTSKILLYEAEEFWVIEKKKTKRWLYRFKLFSAKAEDLIEECEHNQEKLKVPEFLESISQRLEEMEKEFEDIEKERELGLEDKDNEKNVPVPSRPPSEPLKNESSMYGRDDDVKNIVEMLIKPKKDQNHEHDNATIISIVGMGGVGKTRIAQEIYGDKEIIKHFTQRAWVCVSDKFRIDHITKQALVSMTEKVCDLTVFSVIQEKLQNELKGKRFLLVLDDVWNEIYYVSETLGFLRTLGSPGSKIVVTTRSIVVAMTLDTSFDYNLDPLQFHYGWKMLQNHAFNGSNHENNQMLAEIGMKIAEKCNGLPLVIKVLGDLLRDVDGDEGRWNEVLGKNTMEIHNKNGENPIFENLYLSYIHLPALEKRCFLYCSVFPKDHLFDHDELIRLWTAQGILKDEEPNHDCVKGLFNRSFLQTQMVESSHNFRKHELKYSLHDLMHDLAQHILREEKLLISDNSPKSMQDSLHCIEPIAGRTFHHTLYYPIEMESLHLYLRYLRVLIWTDHKVASIPDSICELIHLRHLQLNMPYLGKVPESVCNLYNLWTLHCYSLQQFPDDHIKKLQNLRHIICKDYRTCIPRGIGELAHLQTLPSMTSDHITYCCHDRNSVAGLAELENLHSLSGSLKLVGLANEYKNDEDRMVKFYKKPDLKELRLLWKVDHPSSSTTIINILNNLRPHINLEKLKIKHYQGLHFSDWLGCSKFSKLTHVTLSNCLKCERLPPLGKLVSLKVLKVNMLQNLKEWCKYDQCSFISLESLYILDCPKLCMSYDSRMFSKLQDLEVRGSPQITEICEPHMFDTSLSGIKYLSIGIWKKPTIEVIMESVNHEQYEHLVKAMEGLPPTFDTRDVVLHRCLISSYNQIMYKVKITKSVLHKIWMTPFYHILNMGMLEVDYYCLHDVGARLVNHENGIRFYVQRSFEYFFDVRVIDKMLGLNCIRGMSIDLERGDHETAFWEKYFKGTQDNIDRSDIEKHLVYFSSKNSLTEEEEDDFCRLWLCLVFCTILFPNSQAKLRIKLLRYIQKLDEMRKFNWAEAIFSVISENLTLKDENMKFEDESGRNATIYMNGCVVVLMMSICLELKIYEIDNRYFGVPLTPSNNMDKWLQFLKSWMNSSVMFDLEYLKKFKGKWMSRRYEYEMFEWLETIKSPRFKCLPPGPLFDSESLIP